MARHDVPPSCGDVKTHWDALKNKIGMDADDLLRLKQINGIVVLFKDKNFDHAWAANKADEAFYG